MRAESATLAYVTDGDTIAVNLSGNRGKAKVRIIGIDTPETYPQIECGGLEATASLKRMVRPGSELALYRDPTQATVDRYGRILRFVHTGRGLDVGLAQVETGHARVYVYGGVPFTPYDAYRTAENHARNSADGIWGSC